MLLQVDAVRGCTNISLPHTLFQICCFSSLIPTRADDGLRSTLETVGTQALHTTAVQCLCRLYSTSFPVMVLSTSTQSQVQ